MIEKNTTKTAYYLRSIYEEKPVNVEKLLKNTLQKLPTPGNSEIIFYDKSIIRIEHYRSSEEGLYIHLTQYTSGEETPTIKPKTEVAPDKDSTQKPEPGYEFKDGDSFLLIKDHNIIFCEDGINKKKSTNYLHKFLEQAEIKDQKTLFELSHATNLNKINLIARDGAKSIELSCNAYLASLLPHQKNSSIINYLKDLIRKDESIAEQKALEDTLIKIEIRLDGNKRAINDAQELLRKTAKQVMSDDDQKDKFKIITQSGEIIRENDIVLKKSFSIKKFNKTLNYQEVWHAMHRYFSNITQDNLHEQ